MRPQFAFHTPSALIVSAPTALGHIAVAVADEQVVGTSIAHASGPHAASRLSRMLGEPLEAADFDRPRDVTERLALNVLDKLVRFCDGEPVVLDDVPVAFNHVSTFQRRVMRACRAIPYGGTRTYGELAAAAGSPGAARAVGQVMASNRTPLIVPCHRVVAAGGKLGGFSAPQGLTLKKRLLAIEASPGETLPIFEKSASRQKQTAVAARR